MVIYWGSGQHKDQANTADHQERENKTDDLIKLVWRETERWKRQTTQMQEDRINRTMTFTLKITELLGLTLAT